MMMVMSACFGCGRLFTYNAERVPSIVMDGTREPICADCVAEANRLRAIYSFEPIRILPGAYDPEEVA